MAHPFLLPLEQKEMMAGAVILALCPTTPCIYLTWWPSRISQTLCLFSTSLLRVLPRVIRENYLALFCSLWETRIIKELPNMAIPTQRRKASEPLSDCIFTSSGPSSDIRKPRCKPHATALSNFPFPPQAENTTLLLPQPTAHCGELVMPACSVSSLDTVAHRSPCLASRVGLQ